MLLTSQINHENTALALAHVCTEAATGWILDMSYFTWICRHEYHATQATEQNCLCLEIKIILSTANPDVPHPPLNHILKWQIYLFSNTHRDGDSTTPLFQCFTTLSVNKFLLISNLHLSWFGQSEAASSNCVTCYVEEPDPPQLPALLGRWIQKVKKQRLCSSMALCSMTHPVPSHSSLGLS